MIRLDLSYFYRLASTFAEAKAIKSDEDLFRSYTVLYRLQTTVEQLLNDPTMGSSLRGCQPAAQPLLRLLHTTLEKELTSVLDKYDIAALISNINNLEVVLTSELAVSSAYFVVDKKPYSTLTLVSEGEALFPFDLSRKVPEAVKDMREAGKCLAFELPDATAFHVLRAVESVVRRYWQVASGNRPKPKSRNLGVYIAAMRQHGFGNEKILSSLTQLKDLHRNVIFHPDQSIELEDAVSLIGIANSVASSMLKELPFVLTDPPEPENQSFPALSVEGEVQESA